LTRDEEHVWVTEKRGRIKKGIDRHYSGSFSSFPNASKACPCMIEAGGNPDFPNDLSLKALDSS